MAKSTPIRITASLLAAASEHGAQQHRSATVQLEHWAAVGRAVEAALAPRDLEAIATGLYRVVLEPMSPRPVPDLADVMAELERQRADGRRRV